jgi:DNA-binding NarL/FixJ family response regulator
MRWTGIKGKVKPLDLDAYIEAYRFKHTPVKPPKPPKLHRPTVKELKAERNKKIIEMHNAGASYPEICHALNVSRSAVQQIIWRYNKG